MTARCPNAILRALQAIAAGEPLDTLLALRDQELPTPQSWLDAGWEALASLEDTSFEAACLVELMEQAFIAAGEAREVRRAWSCAAPTQGQILWQRAYARLAGVA